MAKKFTKQYVAGYTEEGTIKKIIAEKGYGFIAVKEHNDAIFYINDNIKLNIKEGDRVEFTSKESGEKTKAIKIKLLSSNSSTENNTKTKTYLPRDTTKIINQIKTNSNFALQLNKFVCFGTVGDKEGKAILETPRSEIISNSFLNKINAKQNNLINMLSLSAKDSFYLETSWRMAVGLGTKSVYDTSLTLHHVYGIPYIPGQALKGIARSWFIQNNIPEGFNLNQEKADKKLEEQIIKEHKIFRNLFGNAKVGDIKEQSGKVIFFDAFPKDTPIISKDIMTPHYGEYYGDTKNTKPPADYYNPTLIPFLTVENTSFIFNIGVKANVDETKAINLLEEAKELLEDALKNNGVGAKTAVGYGYFE